MITKGKKNIVVKQNKQQLLSSIVPRAAQRLRMDVSMWKSAMQMAENPDNQRMYMLHNLYNQFTMDARLNSQIQNRKLKVVSSGFVIKKANGNENEEVTKELVKSAFFNQIISTVWDSVTHGHTLIELSYTNRYNCNLIPRQNVVPTKGVVLKEYTDSSGINYRDTREYETWLLEFGDAFDLGLISKAAPHIIFKRFAQSCWSELCEIYGIPPRVMKTNTADPTALNRAENMMTDMGAAAWFIIDDTENIDFATATSTNGQVYEKLIQLCNNEITLLISGAIIGQDTQYGNKSKEAASISILEDIVEADKRMIEQIMQDKIMPALYQIGFIPTQDLTFAWDQVTDIAELWARTKEVLPYKNIDDKWIKEKFGIEVTGDRQQHGQQLAAPPNDFFY